MATIVRDIVRSPLESAGWFLSGVGLAGIGIWMYNNYLGGNESLDKWKTDLQKKLGIDRLKINKTRFCGIQTRRCSVHDKGQLLCQDVDCLFGPLGCLIDTLNSARESIDVAAFSFSCNVIGEAVLDAHRRGILVRVVTDAESAFASNSYLCQFRTSGIPVRQRLSPYHMHHKFIVLDREILITGSMNFSDSGCVGNWENVVTTSEPGLVEPFVREFQTLWEDFEQGKELIFNEIPAHARRTRATC